MSGNSGRGGTASAAMWEVMRRGCEQVSGPHQPYLGNALENDLLHTYTQPPSSPAIPCIYFSQQMHLLPCHHRSTELDP